MPFTSPYPPLDIPKCNILSYLFPEDRHVPTSPQWIDANNVENNLSQAQMVLLIKRFAVGLDKMKIDEKRAVMVFTPNHIYVPMVYLAAAGSKRYFTGANPVYTVNEVAHQMRTIEAATVFIHPSLLETGLEAAKQAGIPKDKLFQFSDTEQQTLHGVRDWRSMLASKQEAEGWQWDKMEGEPSTSMIATINFSSGTTGLPKGVCISHHNLIANASQVVFNKLHGTRYSENEPPKERWLAFLPLYHAYSQLWTINNACRLRVPVYVMQSFVYEDFLKYIDKYKITSIQAVPPVLVMLSKRPETRKYNLDSLEHVLCGAAPLSNELQNEVSKKFDMVVTQGWGMTETTCAGIMVPGMTIDQTGSIGQLLPNTDARLVDDEGKEVTEEGVPGELCIKGPQIMLEYWQNESATKESKVDGWFLTGDVAVCQQGRFWIVDRKKELIKVNGLQVAPAELEAVLLEHPDIADVAVVGITLNNEEYPRAYVVLQDEAKNRTTEKDVQKFVESKVAKHKQIKGGVKFIDQVPKLASGKIIRKLMKEWSKKDAAEMQKTTKARL